MQALIPLSWQQGEGLGWGAVAGVLLELGSAAGGGGGYAQARVVGGEGVVAGVLGRALENKALVLPVPP